MSDVIVYEKRTCTTCRRVAGLLRERGVDYDDVQYHVEGISQERIREVLLRCHPRANRKHAQMALFPPLVLVPGPLICSQCQAPALEGSTYCAVHLKLNAEASKRSIAREKQRRGLRKSA